MSRPIGSKAKLNGKDVVWSGDWGWQSPASHTKLRNEGKFKFGTQALNRLGQAIKKHTPEPIRKYASDVAAAMAEHEQRRTAPLRAVGVDTSKPDATSRAIQAASNATNVDPRILQIGAAAAQAGLETKAGINALRVLPAARQVERGKSVARAANSVDDGLQLYGGVPMSINKRPAAQTAKAAAASKPTFKADKPQNPLQSGSPPWAATPDLEDARQKMLIRGLPDPNNRFRPQPSLEKVDRVTKERFVTPIDATGKPNANINDFYSKKGAYAVSKGDKTFKLNGEVVNTKGATSRQAEVRQIPGYEDVKIDWQEAHHMRPLKDTFDFVNTFDDPQKALQAIDATKTPRGSTVLNRIDLPQRHHTGKQSAHSRLRNEQPNVPEAGFPLEAQSGTNRWQFLKGLSDDEKLEYLPYLMSDGDQNVKVALQEAFKENFIPAPGTHDPMKDMYIGNFAQQVLMPQSKEARKYNRQIMRIRRAEFNGT